MAVFGPNLRGWNCARYGFSQINEIARLNKARHFVKRSNDQIWLVSANFQKIGGSFIRKSCNANNCNQCPNYYMEITRNNELENVLFSCQ
jgi:hypothetical protein